MITTKFNRLLRKIQSSKIQNKIASGKLVYFESFLATIAFKYIPGQFNEIGKYYAKFYTQDEFEIDPDSTLVFIASRNGRQISKERYDNFHLIKGVVGEREIKTA
jgi:hypothetical protein